MPAPVIYRSTDTNAPVLFGGPGSLISLLDAILVNGYGSAFASGAITSDGTNVVAGDTVTVGSITYTFQASLAAQPPNTVLIGANATASLNLLRATISGLGIAGTDYSVGTLPHPDAWAGALVGLVCPITARKGGVVGNSIALARTSAGTPHITLSGATLTGGGGSDSKAGAGWTKPYSGTAGPQGVYRQPAGSRFYLQVDDSGPGAGAAREARCFGFEAMTAYNVGSGQFPTVAQSTAGSVLRKSLTLDNTARAWMAIVDDRTFYLFTLTGDGSGNYYGFSFGDFYSLIAADAYKCLIMGGSVESTNVSASFFGRMAFAATGTGYTGHWLPRNYSGIGGATNFLKLGDISLSTGAADYITGTVGFPNASDGGLYVAPMRIMDGSSPGGAVSGSLNLRGRMRGMYHVCHPATVFVDGDTFVGSGDYAGRTFMIVKYVHSSASSQAFIAIETTPWEVSA
jgi:hypothetical protein